MCDEEERKREKAEGGGVSRSYEEREVLMVTCLLSK
jgi:hypothetical protein